MTPGTTDPQPTSAIQELTRRVRELTEATQLLQADLTEVRVRLSRLEGEVWPEPGPSLSGSAQEPRTPMAFGNPFDLSNVPKIRESR